MIEEWVRLRLSGVNFQRRDNSRWGVILFPSITRENERIYKGELFTRKYKNEKECPDLLYPLAYMRKTLFDSSSPHGLAKSLQREPF